MRLLLFSVVAGLADAFLPSGRIAECARMAMGLIAVKLVCDLVIEGLERLF